MDRRLNDNNETADVKRERDETAPDSPIDLSQLSTRCRDLTSRSASESCLAPASAAKKRRFKDPPPPPALERATSGVNDNSNQLKYRSMSNADLAGYRTPWLEAAGQSSDPATANPRQQPPQSGARTLPRSDSADVAPNHPANLESLRQRCMSDSRLAGQSSAWPSAFYSSQSAPFSASSAAAAAAAAGPSANSLPFRRNFVNSTSDLLRAATDNSQLEFLLRRTASESFLASSRSGEPASSAAMEVLMRQHQAIQHYQQMLVQQQQHHPADAGGESSSSSSSSYLSPPLLLSLFGYSQMLQSFQAAAQQPMTAIHDPAPGSGQISGGPSSPAVAASSVSGSDGEGGEIEEDDDVNGFPHGKKRSPRALTGKHVRLGTGASPTTLHTLRLKIQERQRMKSVKKGHPSGSAFTAAAAKKNAAAKLKARAK